MNTFADAFAFAGVAGLCGTLFFFTPLWAPQLVFGRLLRSLPKPDKSSIPPFSLSDGLVLITFLAVANGLVTLLRDNVPLTFLIVLAAAANSLVALSWLRCQQFMRQHSIVQQNSRLLMQTVLYPLSILAVAELAMCVMVSLGMLLGTPVIFEAGLSVGLMQYVHNPFTIVPALTLAVSIIIVTLLRAAFKRYVVLGASAVSGAGT